MNGRDRNAPIQRIGGIPAALVGDTLLMMSVEHGQYFSLNGVAARVWELLENPTTLPVLVEKLVAEYEVLPDVCADQLAVFLEGLRQRGLLRDFA